MREGSRTAPPAGGDAARGLFVFLFCRGIASQAQSLGTTTNPPPCCHSRIFIPPAPESAIVNSRWRNENIRNLLRQAVVISHRSPAPLAREIPYIFVVPKRRLGMRPAKRRFAPPRAIIQKGISSSRLSLSPSRTSRILSIRLRMFA